MGLKEELSAVGLTKTESTVYLALLESGPSSFTQVVKCAHVHRTNVSDALSSLIEKGLASCLVQDQKHIYKVSSPTMLQTLVEEKRIMLDRILPQLMLIQPLGGQQLAQVELYEGTGAIRRILLDMIHIKDERIVFGVPRVAAEQLGAFFNEYHQQRIHVRQKMRHIYNSDAKDRRAYLNSLPLTQCRYLPKALDSPVATTVCGDTVMLTLWQKIPVSIVIRNKPIAAAYKRYFEVLWHKAKR